ncbi:MAG TPA: acyl-CoA dehydrogenase family protein [Polyangiaceae bacterium]|nr:acyl-CoA dehydrogenase family protein [Polyangiaceae bacterium]
MHDESFMKSLFFGLIDESRVFPWPERSPAEIDTAHSMTDRVRQFFERPLDSPQGDPRARERTIIGLKNLGCFGTLVPQAYGGLELSRTAHLRVLQEVASGDPNVSAVLNAHHLGVRTLLLFGSNAQKARHLPALARGDTVAEFALAEVGAGSDAAALQARADRQPDGTYRVGGSKLCVSDPALADLFVVFARTSEPEEGVRPKITAFLVERGPGVSSRPATPGAAAASPSELVLDDVRVGKEHVCGEPGEGFRIAMQILGGGRLGVSCHCIGICKRAIQQSVSRCKTERAFGRPIGELELVQDKIATMVSLTWALESMTYLTAAMESSDGDPAPIESAICKVYAGDAVSRVTAHAAQIAAAAGRASDQTCQGLLDAARQGLVHYETSEVVRAYIALLGMQGPGRELADVARAVREPIRSFGLLGELAIRKARNALRAGKMTRHAALFEREAKVFEHYAHVLAGEVDRVLRKHGRDIAEMQCSQERIADMAIALYAIAACIARTTRALERRGEDGARRETDLTRLVVAATARRLAALEAAMTRNDDELRRTVSTRTCADGSYPFDVI